MSKSVHQIESSSGLRHEDKEKLQHFLPGYHHRMFSLHTLTDAMANSG